MRDIRSWVLLRISALAARVQTISLSAAVRRYQVSDEDDEGDTWQDPVSLYQHYGFRSRVVAGSEAITVALRGSTSQRVAIATETPDTGPDDLEDGEVALYCSAGQIIKLDHDGNVQVIPAAGGKVMLGDNNPANLDQVALVTALQTQLNAAIMVFNAHTHAVPVVGVTAGMATVNATSATPNAAQVPVSGIGSSNVEAAK